MTTKTYTIQDGIKIFHTNIDRIYNDYNIKGLDNLYTKEKKHFWFIARKEFIYQEIKKYISIDSKIIDIGAGTGDISRYLIEKMYKNISVGDMYIKGLLYAKEYGIKNCYQLNLLDMPFTNEFDTICIFDVLEHIENDNLALENIYKSLKNKGNIVLSVPSHMWLWNRDDKIAKHKIRYTKKALIHKLKENGFTIITSRYFFISIVPLLYLRTILNKDNKLPIQESEYNQSISINPIVNSVLLFISRIENKINYFLPNIFGGSLLIIAKKNDSI